MPPISQATIQQHLAAGDNAQVAIHKGRHFENLTGYLRFVRLVKVQNGSDPDHFVGPDRQIPLKCCQPMKRRE